MSVKKLTKEDLSVIFIEDKCYVIKADPIFTPARKSLAAPPQNLVK